MKLQLRSLLLGMLGQWLELWLWLELLLILLVSWIKAAAIEDDNIRQLINEMSFMHFK